MNETVTVELSTELASQARALAVATNRRFEDIVTEWVGRGAAERAVEFASDGELLSICDSTLPASVQEELTDLLSRSRESQIDDRGRRRLDELMAAYRQGLVLKAKAWEKAVARGLRASLSDGAA